MAEYLISSSYILKVQHSTRKSTNNESLMRMYRLICWYSKCHNIKWYVVHIHLQSTVINAQYEISGKCVPSKLHNSDTTEIYLLSEIINVALDIEFRNYIEIDIYMFGYLYMYIYSW